MTDLLTTVKELWKHGLCEEEIKAHLHISTRMFGRIMRAIKKEAQTRKVAPLRIALRKTHREAAGHGT